MVGLLTFILMLAIVGLIVWVIITYIPMPPIFRTLIIVFVVIVVLIYLIQMLGTGLALPRLR